VPVLQAEGSSVVTIEGLATGEALHDLQEAFLACGGAQCGICTPGMLLASAQLLKENPEPSIQEIREGLSGNLCRCTGYSQIIEAVAEAARRRKMT
jgi:carbon-monoxide dehydrogenase small subunit